MNTHAIPFSENTGEIIFLVLDMEKFYNILMFKSLSLVNGEILTHHP